MPKQSTRTHCIFNAHKINEILSILNKSDTSLLTKKALRRYRFSVTPQWVTGRRNPCEVTATTDAPRVFFYVATNATAYRFYGVMCRLHHKSEGCDALTGTSFHCLNGSSGGAAFGLAGVVATGIPTPVWAIAILECRNSGDSKYSYATEIITMMATPTPLHPQFIWLFLAVRRSDVSARPQREEVTASTYLAARRVIAREFIASFAGRLPVCGGEK